MINQMLDALQNNSAEITKISTNEFDIKYQSKTHNKVVAYVDIKSKQVKFDSSIYIMPRYMKESEIMAMIYYINEYGVDK